MFDLPLVIVEDNEILLASHEAPQIRSEPQLKSVTKVSYLVLFTCLGLCATEFGLSVMSEYPPMAPIPVWYCNGSDQAGGSGRIPT